MEDYPTPLDTWERLLKEQTVLFRETSSANIELQARVKDLEVELAVWKNAFKDADEQRNALSAKVERLEKDIESSKEDKPIILCVVDGDGNIFLPELIRQGQSGGRQAAQLLTQGINDYLGSSSAPGRRQIWLTIYCNKSGLSETLISREMCTREEFEAFVIGFNQSAPLFSIVDVGNGKEAADAKIKECLRVFTRFPQTAKVVFGGSHDNSYATTLHHLENEGLLEKFVILQGYKDLARELQSFDLPTLKIDGVFMAEKIPPHPFKNTFQPVQIKEFEKFRAASLGDSGQKSGNTANENDEKSSNGTAQLDSSASMSRLKPPPCNFFYLGHCQDGSKCRFAHHYNLSQPQLAELRESAKKTPCPKVNRNQTCPAGESCIQGHFCFRGPTCIFLKQGKCKFTGKNMHNREAPKMPRSKRNTPTPVNAGKANSSSPSSKHGSSLASTPLHSPGRPGPSMLPTLFGPTSPISSAGHPPTPSDIYGFFRS